MSFCTSSFRNRFGKFAFVHRSRRLLDVLASTLDLLLHLSRFWLLAIRCLIHFLAQFINIAQHFALFVAKAFEFTFDFFPLFIARRGTKFGFQLLESFIDHQLTARQLFKAVQYLNLFTLLLSLLFLLLLSLLFGFVTIAFVVQFQLLQLLLRRTAATTSTATLLLLLHLELSGAHFQKRLYDGFFDPHRLGQAS